jgi:D-3-phosphoglycerate dehydrogenase
LSVFLCAFFRAPLQLEKADFITLHVPFTDQTANILSREKYCYTKKGVRINRARGGR